jgi:hypothetical protein
MSVIPIVDDLDDDVDRPLLAGSDHNGIRG